MAVTQIVGPRIAPYWADPVEWTSTRAYEPFTFVTYQGDSYCSRQDTPIGIDITNDDYWVKVSDYNAQAVALQREMTNTIEAAESSMESTIQTAENDITSTINAADASINQKIADADSNMKSQVAQAEAAKDALQDTIDQVATNKTNIQVLSDTRGYKSNCLMIGNSFTVGYYTHNYGMARALQDIGYFDNIYWFTSDGSGFTNHESMTGGVNITDSNNFSALLTQASNSSTFENDSITTLIFNSAMGDTRAIVEGKTNISTSINSTIQKARQLFPNAVIYITYSEQIYSQSIQLAYGSKYPMAQMRAHTIFRDHEGITQPYVYIGWCGYGYNLWTSKYQSPAEAGFCPDGYHPTAQRSTELACNMLQLMNGQTGHVGRCALPNAYSMNHNEMQSSILFTGQDYYLRGPVLSGSCPEDFQISSIIPFFTETTWVKNQNIATYYSVSDGILAFRRPVIPLANNVYLQATLFDYQSLFTLSSEHTVALYSVLSYDDVVENDTTYQSLRLHITPSATNNQSFGEFLPFAIIENMPHCATVDSDLNFLSL